MPFRSKAQERAAFSGALGPEMKAHAKEWASVTDQKHLPEHVKNKKRVEGMKKMASERSIFK